jgi:folate-dependent phosphoribosylglycinamide formyltransferase PurN
MKYMRYAVAVSGSGTNLEAMLFEGLKPDMVIADRPCRGIEIARSAGIMTVEVIDRKAYGYKSSGVAWDRRGFTKAATDLMVENGIQVLMMAGFMTIWDDRISEHLWVINTHPALLPKYKGDKAVAETLAAGETTSGCTIHIATEILDDERFILAQAMVPVLPDDSVETLWERIKVEERRLYPRVIRDILSGKIKLDEVMATA